MRLTFLFLVFSILISCSTDEPGKGDTVKTDSITQHAPDTIAVFVDSNSIGTPKRNKLYIASLKINDSTTSALIRFYTKDRHDWLLKSEFQDPYWSVNVIEPDIEDFNNDGFRDFIYIKGTGARGGNGINSLFIYDKTRDKIFLVTNSESYPNLRYNPTTKSIVSYILTGSNETVFLRLDSNYLRPYASVEQEDIVNVYEYDTNGNRKLAFVDSTNRYEDYANFINYKPLTIKKR